ncbi:DUF2607 family protein [Aliivibrio fischeri]|uniref:DUF2607 family protein n=1 Tax=Aliivibrio fischeri TaxID=668 RepID=A0A6N3Z5M7_ALIFS|nr:DUF2607 family protein [Aliivibrio fischeri]MUK37212.1 DUF2607 family protein [Aliivibrio fischeri]MUK47471.1 DUF2607 family protein [Aliivibrio fischeri]MUK82784.1 DUF2607 family protein [Aliivibrio fischeri]MUK86319.1 DUF2607 family protein [Aliivibrio fischeri]
MQSYFFTKQRWLNWGFAILLALFGILVANHQVDTNLHHHENHHCQQFQSFSSGICINVTSPPVIPQLIICSLFSIVENSSPLNITVHSRAPPTPSIL